MENKSYQLRYLPMFRDGCEFKGFTIIFRGKYQKKFI